MDLSSRRRERTPLIVLAFPFFFFLPPSPSFPSLLFHYISFFHPFFPAFFKSVGRSTACVWRVIDSTSNSIKRENALSAQRRHGFDDWSSPIGPTTVDRGFFFFSLFLEKLPLDSNGWKKEKSIWIYASFSSFFFFCSFLAFFLSFFLSFHKSKRNSFYLDARFLKKKKNEERSIPPPKSK